MTKQIFDCILALVGIIALLPVWVLITTAVLLEDGMPVFFVQERVGKDGRRFKIIKFRTMKKEKHPYKIVDLLKNDPRITKAGHLLRITAMDESPQLINILKGEMSFVGPKPLPYAIEDHERFKYPCLASVPGYADRIQVRPGLTGLAQVYAKKNIPHRNKFRYDSIYIRNQSFLLDIRLILYSFLITFKGKWESAGRKI